MLTIYKRGIRSTYVNGKYCYYISIRLPRSMMIRLVSVFFNKKIMWKEHYFSVDTCIQILSLLGYYNFSCVFWNHQLTSMYSNNLVIHWKLLAWLFWWALLYFSVDMYALYNLSLFRNYPPISFNIFPVVFATHERKSPYSIFFLKSFGNRLFFKKSRFLNEYFRKSCPSIQYKLMS